MTITNDRLLEMRNTFALTLPVQRGRVTAPVEDAELVAALDELADLRAYKERMEAGLAELRDFMCERWGKAADESKREFIDNLDAKGCDLGLWRDPPQAEVQP